MLRARLLLLRRVLIWGFAAWALSALGFVLYASVESARAGAGLDGIKGRVGALDVLGEEHALRTASQRFDVADRLFSSPVLAPVRALPVIGRQLDGADTIVGAGAELTERTADTVDAVAVLAQGASPDGAERLALLRAVRAELVGLRQSVASVELGERDDLLGPVRGGHRRATEHVAAFDRTLADAIRATGTVEVLLEGPTAYLVLLANNAEMRVGSGMFLAAGVLELRDGRLRLGPVEPAADLVLDDPVAVPPAVEELWGWAHPGRDIRSLGLSPGFPVSGAIAARIWESAGRPPVDGVLAVDVVAIRELLDVIGPVEAGGRTLAADEVVPFLLHDQYESVRSERDTATRREQLAEVARGAVAEFAAQPVDLDRLGVALRRSAEGRHVMAWSPDEAAQRLWRDLGLAGMLTEQSLLVGVANSDASKLDQFLATRAVLVTEPEGDHHVGVTLLVEVTNRTPRGEPPYVVGPDRSADYAGVLVAYLPARGSGVEVRGGDLIASGKDGPSTVAAVNVDLDPGQSVEVTIRFRLPEREAARMVLEPSARLPPLRWEVGGAVLEGRDRRRRIDVGAPFG